jgi:hypothetical protein
MPTAAWLHFSVTSLTCRRYSHDALFHLSMKLTSSTNELGRDTLTLSTGLGIVTYTH